MKKIKIKLHWKLSVVFSLALVIGLIFVYVFLSMNLKNYLEDLIITNKKKELHLLRDNIKNQIVNKSFNKPDFILKKYSKILNLRLSFIDQSGVVISDSEDIDPSNVENHIGRPEIQEVIKNGFGISKRKSTTINKDLIYMALPIDDTGQNGFIRVAIFLDDLSVLDSNLKRTIAYTLIVVFFLALIFIIVTLFVISRPINKMSEIARAMANGDFLVKPNFNSNDEIGDLSVALTNLSCQVEDKIEKIKEEREKLNAVLLNMFEGIIVVDKNYKIMLMNPSIKKLLYIVSNFEGLNLNEIVNNLSIIQIVDQILCNKEEFITSEIEINIPRAKVLKINAVPLLKNGVTEGVVLVFHDITKLRNLEKLKQEFVANVSHELRTPVTNIKGYAETILEGAIDDKENLIDFINIISKESGRLATLIDDLLTLSSIESGKQNLDIVKCDIKPIIYECISVLNNFIKKKNHSVEVLVDENVTKISIDQKRIEQVLFNLLDNAIKYSSENGKIIISVSNQNDFVQIDVKDNGIGIPSEDIPRLFERFYRVDKARSRNMGGTGLGLSIVKHIVISHGGKVWLKSVPNQGSVFSFSIPKK